MDIHVSKEQQLAFALGIMSPLSIKIYGMLMQTSKSINQATSEWDASLFGNHRAVKLLSMARTTKKGKEQNTLAQSYYVCNSTWQEWPIMLCCKFYIPIHNHSFKRKRNAKDILRDFVMCMQQSIGYNTGIIRVEFKRSVKPQNLSNLLST